MAGVALAGCRRIVAEGNQRPGSGAGVTAIALT